MKKNTYLYAMMLCAGAALSACTDNTPVPGAGEGEKPLGGVAIDLSQTRASSDYVDAGQLIDRVTISRTDVDPKNGTNWIKNANGLSSNRIDLPENGDGSYYDKDRDLFFIKKDKNAELFTNWLQKDGTFVYLGYHNSDQFSGYPDPAKYGNYNPKGIKQYGGIQWYDFKPLDVIKYNAKDWQPKYSKNGDPNKATEEYHTLSTNGVYGYAKDFLNICGLRWMNYDSFNKFPRNDTPPEFGGLGRDNEWQLSARYVRGAMVYQWRTDVIGALSKQRLMFFGRQPYKANTAPSDAAAGFSPYVYRNFPMQSVMSRLIVKVQVNKDVLIKDFVHINDLLVMQIPQFFRVDGQKMDFPLLDSDDYSDQGFAYDGEKVQNDLFGTGGSQYNYLWIEDFETASELTESTISYKNYQVAMKFHPIRFKGGTLYTAYQKDKDDLVVPENYKNFNDGALHTVLDVYIPPFDPVGTKVERFVRGNDRGNNPYDFNSPNFRQGQGLTATDATYLNRNKKPWLNTPYFPHIRVDYVSPNSTGTDVVPANYDDIPIGEFNRALQKQAGLSERGIRFVPSIIRPGHTYVVTIRVGFGADLIVETYDPDPQNGWYREMVFDKRGMVHSSIKDLYKPDEEVYTTF
mgnify:FL=1